MWSVVCKVDLKRIRRGRGCDHWGRCCNCGCVRCSETCQEKINLQTHSATLPASLSNNLFSSHKDGTWRIELNLNQTIQGCRSHYNQYMAILLFACVCAASASLQNVPKTKVKLQIKFKCSEISAIGYCNALTIAFFNFFLFPLTHCMSAEVLSTVFSAFDWFEKPSKAV